MSKLKPEQVDRLERLLVSHYFVWVEGMLAICRGTGQGGRVGGGLTADDLSQGGLFPDLSDPSTYGCLLATARKALIDIEGTGMTLDAPQLHEDGEWVCAIRDPEDDTVSNLFSAEGEGECLAEALICMGL
jgi:hypothetical protein